MFLLVGANQCLRATSTTARSSNAPHQSSLVATRSDRVPSAWRTDSCRRRSTTAASRRSPRLPRNTNTWPENGFSVSVVCTSAARPSIPLRISVTPAASHTRVPAANRSSLREYVEHATQRLRIDTTAQMNARTVEFNLDGALHPRAFASPRHRPGRLRRAATHRCRRRHGYRQHAGRVASPPSPSARAAG